MYITTCDECQSDSRRREDFMELSVPIVDSEEESSESQQTGKSKRGTKSTGKRDVDVQECLNAYLFPERLEGDNGYT